MSPGGIEKKLAEAQSNQSKKRKRIFGYGALAIFTALLVVAFVYLVIQLDRARTQLRQVETSVEASVEASNSQPVADAGDTAALPPNDATEITRPANADEKNTGAGVFRRQFMAQLAQYESEVEPKLAEIRLQHWAGEKHAELQNLKAEAIEHFSRSDYLPAREALQRARTLATEAAAIYVRRLKTLKGEAEAAFANDRAPEAEKAVHQALHLSPDDADLLALQKRIAVMPEVLDWLRRAGVARNENRPEKEAAALEISIPPARRPARASWQYRGG